MRLRAAAWQGQAELVALAQAPAQPHVPTVPLPPALHRLLDPLADVQLPPVHSMAGKRLNNRELDKVLAALARSESLWRRALTLHRWLQVRRCLCRRLCTRGRWWRA